MRPIVSSYTAWYQILSAGVKFGVNIAGMYVCTRMYEKACPARHYAQRSAGRCPLRSEICGEVRFITIVLLSQRSSRD